MPTVAEQLKQAREAQGLKIHEVAEATKIRGDHIRALEAGNYDIFRRRCIFADLCGRTRVC